MSLFNWSSVDFLNKICRMYGSLTGLFFIQVFEVLPQFYQLWLHRLHLFLDFVLAKRIALCTAVFPLLQLYLKFSLLHGVPMPENRSWHDYFARLNMHSFCIPHFFFFIAQLHHLFGFHCTTHNVAFKILLTFVSFELRISVDIFSQQCLHRHIFNSRLLTKYPNSTGHRLIWVLEGMVPVVQFLFWQQMDAKRTCNCLHEWANSLYLDRTFIPFIK